MVEHRLQMWQARQLHEVPDSDEDRRALALRCGFTGREALEEFDSTLANVRSRVRRLSEKHYLDSSDEQDAYFVLLTAEEPPEEIIDATIGDVGFTDIPNVLRILHGLAKEPFFILSQSKTERNLVLLLPDLLSQIAASPHPDTTLSNFRHIIEAVGGRSQFYAQLLRRPQALEILTALAGWANYPVAYLRRFQGLPDEVLSRIRQSEIVEDDLYREAKTVIEGVDDYLPQLGSCRCAMPWS